MKTKIYGKGRLSRGAQALKAKLEADPAFRHKREVLARVKDGTATDADLAEYREMQRPLREGRQDIVRG